MVQKWEYNIVPDIWRNLFRQIRVYLKEDDWRVAHALAKAHAHARPGSRGVGRWSGLKPYPPLRPQPQLYEVVFKEKDSFK